MFLRCTHFFVCLEHFFNICVPYLWALCSESVWVKNAQRGKCPNTEFFRPEYRKYESIPTSIFQCNGHSVKSVQIRSFSGLYFLYSVRIQRNTDQKKLRIWTLFTQLYDPDLWLSLSGFFCCLSFFRLFDLILLYAIVLYLFVSLIPSLTVFLQSCIAFLLFSLIVLLLYLPSFRNFFQDRETQTSLTTWQG